MLLTLISASKEQRQSAIQLRCATQPQASTPSYSRVTTQLCCPAAKRKAARHIDGISPEKCSAQLCSAAT